MQDILANLDRIETMAAELVRHALRGEALRAAADGEILDVLRHTARVQRLLDAVMIEAVGEATERSAVPDRDDRMTSRYGCHDVSELVQRATLVSSASAV